MMDGYRHHMLHVLGMSRMSVSLNHRIEPAVLISGVVDSQDGTVGFMEGVGTLDDIPIPSLFLLLNIASVMILNSVLESILGVVL